MTSKERLRLCGTDDRAGIDGEPEDGSLGLRLIRTFAKQVNGTLSIRSGSGTEVSVVIGPQYSS